MGQDGMISFLPYATVSGNRCIAELGMGSQFSQTCWDPEFGQLFSSGRGALDRILQHLHLSRSDEVWVTSTFDLPNISSCVTCTIFNHCKPSRVIGANTRAILAIHEFGVPHPRIDELSIVAQQLEIPLIEDCAHTISSRYRNNTVGTVGKWSILSFPKVFPMKFGGAIVGPPIPQKDAEVACAPILEEINNDLHRHLLFAGQYAEARREIFMRLYGKATDLGIQPLYMLGPGIVPWMFPIRTNNPENSIALAHQMGIDCARWHGSNLVVLPCHQCLNLTQLECIERYLELLTLQCEKP